MRRYNYPYNGKQYVLNQNTLEVHDLDRETHECKIDKIEPDHVYNCDSYEEALGHSIMILQKKCNGCAHCMPERDTD